MEGSVQQAHEESLLEMERKMGLDMVAPYVTIKNCTPRTTQVGLTHKRIFIIGNIDANSINLSEFGEV
jgi:hypothetical protein